jgi:hypothetical protein
MQGVRVELCPSRADDCKALSCCRLVSARWFFRRAAGSPTYIALFGCVLLLPIIKHILRLSEKRIPKTVISTSIVSSQSQSYPNPPFPTKVESAAAAHNTTMVVSRCKAHFSYHMAVRERSALTLSLPLYALIPLTISCPSNNTSTPHAVFTLPSPSTTQKASQSRKHCTDFPSNSTTSSS